VNPTLVVAFLRLRLTSPLRLGLLLLLTLFPLGAAVITTSLSPLGGLGAPIALILAAGAIGQDVSSGTLQLLLVRPVSRPSVIVNRWLASVLAAAGLTIAVLILGTIGLLLKGTHPDALDLGRMVLESTCGAAGSAAVMIMLSTLVGGLGDVALLLLAMIMTQMVEGLATFEHWGWVVRASEEAKDALLPQLSFEWMLHHTPPSWFAIVSWASTLTLALAVAIARLNRRELSYAAG